MRSIVIIGMAAASLTLSGCATINEAMYSDDRLAEITALHLGVSPSEITISDRRTTAMGSYYTVNRGGKATRCHIYANIGDMGLAPPPPTCGDQMGRNPFTG